MIQPEFDGMKKTENVVPKVRKPRRSKCASCSDPIEVGEEVYGDQGTDYYNRPLHEPCKEGDYPEATIRVFFPGDHGTAEDIEQNAYNVFEIRSGSNETSGEQFGSENIGIWRSVYVRTDGWRGYYTIKPPRGWKQLHSDCALSHSEDARQLAEFDKALRGVLTGMGIIMVRAVCLTSNVFSAGVDYFVKGKDMKKAASYAEKLKEAYRDPARFHTTALTGKDPADQTPEDKLIGLVGAVILGEKK